ncbi:MAG: class IIb bacteriocin, lactobin A/cerein 7B family [bacterium]|nr:class IIb bacteriocin, lactobin A/cerein 7B family [bacterium]
MINIDNNELMSIDGGISTWTAVGIGAAVVFLIGVVDGFFRPLKCN